jgi:hypothetical protein
MCVSNFKFFSGVIPPDPHDKGIEGRGRERRGRERRGRKGRGGEGGERRGRKGRGARDGRDMGWGEPPRIQILATALPLRAWIANLLCTDAYTAFSGIGFWSNPPLSITMAATSLKVYGLPRLPIKVCTFYSESSPGPKNVKKIQYSSQTIYYALFNSNRFPFFSSEWPFKCEKLTEKA